MSYSKELKRLVNSDIPNIKKFGRNSNALKILLEETSFLIGKHKLAQRVWYVRNDIHEQVKCPNCGKDSLIKINKEGINKISFCSMNCYVSYKDPETGLTIRQLNGLKQSKTKAIKDSDGLSISEKAAKKASETMKKKGLDGLSIYEKSSKKIKTVLSKINSETGLTGYQEIGKKSKETKYEINPESGLTVHQEIGLKTKETLSKINPETGLSGYQENGKKISNALNMINPGTRMTKGEERGLKVSNTLNAINPNTGLSKAQEIGLKVSNTLNVINPNTGLSKAQEIHEKAKKTKKMIRFQIYNSKINSEYKILTSEEEFLINEDFKLIKYQHSCGEIRESYWPYIRCLKCYPYIKSIAENEILEYCKTFTNNVISNDRYLIKPKELDIVLPDHNLAIEYDGLYWHSSDSIETELTEYHLSKTQHCMENGYQLFHIFENEWEDSIKKDIWKSIISNKLGQSERIYARKCEIRNVDTKLVKAFLNSNHLQGYVPSSNNIGLFYQDELISLMTFSKSRYGKKYEWELLRFCNKKYTSVIGGASRLFKHFTRTNNGIIVSYADMRRSNGNLYVILGFELSHISEPNYWYFKNNNMVLESRIKYQKHKLGSILEEYDAKLSESENMYINGYRKIYDCGNQVWVYKN